MFQTKIAKIKVPTSNVTINGGCYDIIATMKLIWPSGKNSSADANEKQNSITFTFAKKEKSEVYNIRAEIFTDEKYFENVESTCTSNCTIELKNTWSFLSLMLKSDKSV